MVKTVLTLCSPGVGGTLTREPIVNGTVCNSKSPRNGPGTNRTTVDFVLWALLTSDGSMEAIRMIQAPSAPSLSNLMLRCPALRKRDRSGRLAQAVGESTSSLTMTINCKIRRKQPAVSSAVIQVLHQQRPNGLRPLSGCRFRLSIHPTQTLLFALLLVH